MEKEAVGGDVGEMGGPSEPARPLAWSRVDRIFDLALDLDGEERSAFVRQACAGDPALERQVASLLRFAETEASGIETAGGLARLLETAETLVGHESDPELELEAGAVIGSWRIVREIGRGGMAVVYLAERADSANFDQRVAIKVMRGSRKKSSEAVRRLERERQILALASHPNLATVIDGGTTTDGRPYVVLEYVEGVTIDRYCDERGLDVEARLRLFLQLAEGVGYAHRRLVVHRDIKPSNVLVDGEGTVKLLDFGIAKLIDSPLDLEATKAGVRALTPAWASPEQLRAEAVTTTSDVYQLGLLLYVLLTGRSPYPNLRRGSLVELMARVIDHEPTAPSRVVSDESRRPPTSGVVEVGESSDPEAIARQRGVSVSGLARHLKGDLDAILLQCLRSSPEHRYRSVEGLIDDVRRFLDRRPVRARRHTAAYRFGKFARRHGWSLSMLGLLALVTVAGAVSFVQQARLVESERNRANEEVRQAQMTLDYLEDTFNVLDPEQARGAVLTAPEILRRGVEKMEGRFENEPLARAKLLGTLGRLFLNLGLYGDAAPLLDEAVALREREGERSLELAGLYTELGRLHYRKGEFQRAEPLFRRGLDLRRELNGPEDPELVGNRLNLANIRLSLGDPVGAEVEYRSLLSGVRERLGDDDPIVLGILNNLSAALSQQDRHEESLALLEELVVLREKAQGADHPDALGAAYNLAGTYADLELWSQARDLHLRVLEQRRRVLGEKHPETLRSRANHAQSVFQSGDRERGLELFEDSRATVLAELGADDPVSLSFEEMYTSSLFEVGRKEEACVLRRDLVERVRRVFGAEHPATVQLEAESGACSP